MTQGPASRLLALKPALDRLYRRYNRPDAVADPVAFVRRYPAAADREVVGFLAAGLAFGRVAGILASVERLLREMGPSPADYLRGLNPARARRALASLVHRWTRGDDIVALLAVLQHMLLEGGSVEGFFAAGLPPGAEDVTAALESFSSRALAVDVRGAYDGRPRRPGVAYFFPRPSSGGACKRLNLFLRWMVRRDAVDPGGWSAVSSSQLVVPLDTHVVRVGRCLRLTGYASPGWRMAADITRSLRLIDPRDPVKYDFALCHLGMTNACGFMRPQADARCPLRGACRPAPRRRRPSRPPSGPR